MRSEISFANDDYDYVVYEYFEQEKNINQSGDPISDRPKKATIKEIISTELVHADFVTLDGPLACDLRKCFNNLRLCSSYPKSIDIWGIIKKF